MASRRDYYEILGVSRTASQAEIRTAYRRLARQYHPDLNKGVDAEERFKEINEAYEVLSDDQKRGMYDRFGHAGVSGQPGAGGFEGGLGDIFEQFFGGFARASGGMRRTGPRPGNDLKTTVTVDFEEAVKGTMVELEVERLESCPTCHGTGAAPGTSPIRCVQCGGTGEVRHARQSIFGQVVVTDTCPRCRGEGEVVTTPCPTCNGQKRQRVTQHLEVDVPPGIDDGMRIRLAGEGDQGLQGGPPGNLYVDVRVRPHEYFRRDGQNILLDVEINVAQAALGAEIEVPTIDGMQPLSIPAGTQTGQVFRLRGKGVPHVRNEDLRGDQLINVFVKTPANLTSEQRALFEQLADTLGSDVSHTNHKGGFFDKLREAFR
ncbi:MAG: molecular chaperone DnaJ [Chloroflexota bacterium]|nr:molecular chaperone DnaJ [Chloroflexota bacterium]